MVVVNHRLQCLECEICGDTTYVSPRGFENAEKQLMLQQRMAAEHKECEQYRHKPDLARTYRQFRNNLAREQAKHQPRGAKR